MNCDLALEQMMEADLAELSARGQTELSLHITACERCRAVAAELVAGHEKLATGVRALDADDRIEEVLEGVRAQAAIRRRRAIVKLALLPLAAAAAFFLLVPGDGARTPSTPTLGQADVPSRPTVTLPPATNAMVLQTENPKISVVWFY